MGEWMKGIKFLHEGHVGPPEVDGKEFYTLGAVGQPVSTQERNGVQSRCLVVVG
jgi:hypothetical protein